MIAFIFILCGFIYGSNYFIFNKPYGIRGSPPLGVYILSIKWWNIYFNYYTRLDKAYTSVIMKLPTRKNIKEYSVLYCGGKFKFFTTIISKH